MRVYTLKPPRTVPFVKTTSWDGVTYYADAPSASSLEYVPVHGPGTYYPIEFSLPEIYRLLFSTQLAEFKLNVSGSIVYEGDYVTTHSYSGSYILPMAHNVICEDSPGPYPVIKPVYVIQNQEHKAFFDGVYGISCLSNSVHWYPIPAPAVVVDWAGFTDADSLESIFLNSFTPITVNITSNAPGYVPTTNNVFFYGSAYINNFSIGDDDKYYLGVSFGVTTPLLSTIKAPDRILAGTFTIAGKSVNIYKPTVGISNSISASASISILRYLEYDPVDGSGPIWDKTTGAMLRQPYA